MSAAHRRAKEYDLAARLTRRRYELMGQEGGIPHHSNYSQKCVAATIGVDAPVLCQWEHGVQLPVPWVMWERWARAVRMAFNIELIER